MSLIATARALDDPRFLWRVRAATLNLAIQKYGSSNLNDKAFAQDVLDYPMQPVPTLEALVANYPDVTALIVTDEHNSVNTEKVTDEAIIKAVAQYWAPVALRKAEIREATKPKV